jgi:predicted secreted protein
MSTHTLRRARLITAAALTVSTIALVGCASGSKTSTSTADSSSSNSKSSAIASSKASAKPMSRTVTASNRSQSRDITSAIKGQTFTVQLPTANASGYAWRLAPASADDKFVRLQDLKQQQNAMSDSPGAAAQDVFTFRANRNGQTTLTFIYDRPWSNEAPKRMFTLDVDVYKNARELAQANGESAMPQ